MAPRVATDCLRHPRLLKWPLVGPADAHELRIERALARQRSQPFVGTVNDVEEHPRFRGEAIGGRIT